MSMSVRTVSEITYYNALISLKTDVFVKEYVLIGFFSLKLASDLRSSPAVDLSGVYLKLQKSTVH